MGVRGRNICEIEGVERGVEERKPKIGELGMIT